MRYVLICLLGDCMTLILRYIRKLESRDSDIREARLALREKQEELSEMTLRKELAEKRFVTQQHEHEMNVEQLKRKLEEAQNQLKRKVSLFPLFFNWFTVNWLPVSFFQMSRSLDNRRRSLKRQWTIFKPISTVWNRRRGN